MLTQVLLHAGATPSLPDPMTGPRAAQHLKHLLPTLTYPVDGLEPCIDRRTIQLHHGKHHGSYVDKLNEALAPYPELRQHQANWLMLNLLKVPKEARTAVRHNVGGHVNHSLFWHAMSPEGGGAPSGALAEAIVRDFGGFEAFKDKFAEAGLKLFGSGWVWLVSSPSDGGKLQVLTTFGHENPMPQGYYPILVNDVWEHAYYLKHENRRADYLKGWWAVANWDEAARRYARSAGTDRDDWEVEVEPERA
jgi:Fe-Mn family superoxide dismutase